MLPVDVERIPPPVSALRQPSLCIAPFRGIAACLNLDSGRKKLAHILFSIYR